MTLESPGKLAGGEWDGALASTRRIWSEVLGIGEVRDEDNFFALGGNSLQALRVVSTMRAAGFELDLLQIFTALDLRSLVGEITLPASPLPSRDSAPDPVLEPTAAASDASADAAAYDALPLTPLQAGMLFHHSSDPLNDPYVVFRSYEFPNEAALRAYAAALNGAIARHPILRTSYSWDDSSGPLQHERPAAELVVEHVELAASGNGLAELRAAALENGAPLDLRSAPIFRLLAGREPDSNRWIGLEITHHIAGDLFTTTLLQAELAAELEGNGRIETQAKGSFRDLVGRINARSARPEATAFFREHLAGLERPSIPYGLDVSLDNAAHQRAAELELSGESYRNLARIAAAEGVGLAALVHFAYGAFLSLVSNADDGVFGTVLSGRTEENRTVFGPAISTLPFRVRGGRRSVKESLRETQASLLNVVAYQETALDAIKAVSEFDEPQPLFVAVLNYLPAAEGATPFPIETPNGPIRLLGFEERTNYPVVLSVEDTDESLRFRLQTDERLDPERMLSQLQVLLERTASDLADGLESTVAELPLLSEAQVEAALSVMPPEIDGAGVCVHEAFRSRCRETPNATAITHGDRSCTYRELDNLSDALAADLVAAGVRVESRVVLCVSRSIEMIAGALAVLKAGGSYVPVDPRSPVDRIAHILDDCGPSVILVDSEGARALHEAGMDGTSDIQVDIARSLQSDATRDATVLPGARPNDLAYIIYTSGSTGAPKGVMVEHRQLSRLFSAAREHIGFGSSDVWTLFHSFAFDFSVWEMWGSLTTGGRLLLVNEEETTQPALFYETVCREQVSILSQTPSAFQSFMAAQAVSASEHRIRFVIFGGEKLEFDRLQPWFADCRNESATLVNMYGITETTVHVTAREVRREDLKGSPQSYIGQPLRDLVIYLLDEHRRPVPQGVAGEIYVGGLGVARGYWGRPELTAERFSRHPLREDVRLYKSGDVGRMSASGDIEFIGRNDAQVKLRGFRIELGEIEAAARKISSVSDAVAVLLEDAAGEPYIVLYYIGVDASATPTHLRASLASSLPEYMLPAAYPRVDEWPLTINGKLDRQKLPRPAADSFVHRNRIAPVGFLENAAAAGWSEVLGVPAVYRGDNFLELGGHSLRALQLVSWLKSKGFQANVRAVLTSSSLADFASQVEHVGGARDRKSPAGDEQAPAAATDALARLAGEGQPANVRDFYPLSALQEGILFESLRSLEGDVYIQSTLLSLDSWHAAQRFLGALNSVVSRHDMLRTSFHWEGLPEPVQTVWSRAEVKLELVEDLVPGLDVGAQLLARVDPAHCRLRLDRAPLMRLVAANAPGTSRWVAVWQQHHLIEDHVSIEVILDEIRGELRGEPAEPPPSGAFRDGIARGLEAARSESHAAYFQSVLAGIEEPTHPLTGRLGTPLAGDRNEFVCMLSDELADAVRNCSRVLRASPASIFHLAWGVVAARTSGQRDVTFGTIMSGRSLDPAPDGRPTVGFFINTLPVRIRLTDSSVEEALRSTHDQLATLLLHEGAAINQLQRGSGLPSAGDLLTSLFNYRRADEDEGPEDSRRLDLAPGISIISATEQTSFPVAVAVDEYRAAFRLTVQVSNGFPAERAAGMIVTALERILEALHHDPSRQIEKISILTPDELAFEAATGRQSSPVLNPDATILHFFRSRARDQGDQLAVVSEEGELSYAELDRKSDALALILKPRLRDQAIPLVANLMPRCTDLIVAMLAILKAGAAYIPLDPDYGAGRISDILAEASPSLLLVNSDTAALAGAVRATGPNVPVLDVGELDLGAADAPPLPDPGPGTVAYVIYTSGSTGRPKGVVVGHQNLLNFVAWHKRAFGVGTGSITTSMAGLGFDALGFEIWPALTGGATLHLMPQRLTGNVEAMLDWWVQANPDVTFLPASLASYAMSRVDRIPRLRQLHFGGDRIHGPLGFPLARVRVFNNYGPAETTIVATFAELDPNDPEPPIGHPVDNARIYLLDPVGQPVPTGFIGEVYIGGAVVACGYLGRPDLTSERFLESPFVPGERLYKSGDLAFRRDDGQLVYAGRTDDQIKIRSARVELGEVEAHLRSLANLRDLLVVPCSPSGGETELVCYFVCGSEERVDGLKLRAALAQRVPQYMVPAFFVELEAIPLTANGKPDRNALPLPTPVSGPHSEEPANPMEAAIAAVWRDLLGTAEVGPDSDFFLLGGHSLLAMRALAPLSELSGRQIRVAEIIDAPTPRQLASVIAQGHGLERLPLRYFQRRNPTDPLFLIMPTILGSTDFFARLAASLPPQFECAAWNPPCADDGAQPVGIVDLGVMCAREIEDLVQHRDVVLFGWSFGGLIAIETFRALPSKRIALVLADSFVRTRAGGANDQETAAVFNNVLAQEGHDPAGNPAASLFERFRANYAASLDYAAKAVEDGRPVFDLRAKSRPSGDGDDPRPLTDAAGISARRFEVEGDHYFINDIHGAEAVARAALAALDALRRES